MHFITPRLSPPSISLKQGKHNKPPKYTSHQRIMSSSFGGFPFPGIPGATAAGGVPLGMMVPPSTTVTSTDAGIGTGAGTGTAPLSALTSTPSKAKKANDKRKQLQDRRERAKLHARKCREKKKHELENLQEEEKLLREENLRLRALIRSKMPDQAQNIVSECCYSSERVRHLNPYIFQQAVGDTSSLSPTARAAPSSPPAQLGRNDFDLIESLSAGKQPFVLTDPRLPDNPIVYCSDSFCELTGYTRKEVIGRNCRFLQTIGTDPSAVDQVRRAIESGADCTTVMLNARSDDTTFWNRLFVAPLRDRRGRIINYVGVQTETDDPTKSDECVVGMDTAADETGTANSTKELTIKRIPDPSATIDISAANVEPMPFFNDPEPPVGGEGEANDEDLLDIDWVGLAESLEKDYSGAPDEISRGPKEWGSSWIGKLDDDSNESAGDIQDGSATSSRYVQRPRLFATKVVRSEVINALLSSHGDVTDSRFVAALDVLSSFYKSSRTDVTDRDLYRQLMNGSWRSFSRPAFQGCLGMKNDGSFVYELGTMSFGMFRPANLRCSIQNTLTHVSPATRPSDGSPTIAPWSLRRELAVLNDGEDVPNGNISDQNYSMLKTYDIAMSLTVEPAEEDSSPAVAPIQAVKLVKGYMLPDPSVPNRLTIWFVGGRLSPVVSNGKTLYGSDEGVAPAEWKEMFGRDQKKTWSDSIRNAGAKLFLGAELPHGMSADGSLSYQLHRPFGGHGKTYIDVLYYDEHVLVTRGNRGTVYVASREEGASAVATSHSTSTGFQLKIDPPSATKKRKISDIGDDLAANSMKSDQGEAKKMCSVKSLPPTVSPMSSSLADAASMRAERRNSGINHRPKGISPTVYPVPETQTHDVGGVRNILQSVEAFFSWGK